MSKSKSEIRNEIRAARKINPVHRNFDYLLDIPEVSNAEIIASYWPTEFEPNIEQLNEKLVNCGKILLLPRISNEVIEFVKSDGKDLVKKGIFNEPSGNTYFGEIDLVLTPALAVSRDGFRLGQGGGFYDRFLKSTSAYRIAILNESEFIKSMPTEFHDEKVDAVALPSGLMRISK